ncbi:MAG: hypothetical protein R2713_13975 [Ilumatobacteraceae bacterium]
MQLSRQFFDAQRAIVSKVGRHEAALLDQHAADDLLDLDAWDAGAATRQLAALLDGWWSALNSSAGQAMDEATARRALVRQVELIEARHSSPAAVPAAPATVARAGVALPAPAASRGTQAAAIPPRSRPATQAALPGAVREVLDHSDGVDLRSLLSALGDVLRPMPTPMPAMAGTGSVAPTEPQQPQLTMRREAVAHHAPATTRSASPRDLVILEEAPTVREIGVDRDQSLARLELLEQDRRRFWSDGGADEQDGGWFPTQAVVSIAAATAALTAAMALIG